MSVIETPYCTQQTGGLTRGITLRAIRAEDADRPTKSASATDAGATPDIACNTLPCSFTWMGLLTLFRRSRASNSACATDPPAACCARVWAFRVGVHRGSQGSPLRRLVCRWLVHAVPSPALPERLAVLIAVWIVAPWSGGCPAGDLLAPLQGCLAKHAGFSRLTIDPVGPPARPFRQPPYGALSGVARGLRGRPKRVSLDHRRRRKIHELNQWIDGVTYDTSYVAPLRHQLCRRFVVI